MGHRIGKKGTNYVYLDTGKSVKGDKDRTCGHCNQPNTKEGYDGCCIGRLEGITNACCGHGDVTQSYVVIEGKEMVLRLEGETALNWIREMVK